MGWKRKNCVNIACTQSKTIRQATQQQFGQGVCSLEQHWPSLLVTPYLFLTFCTVPAQQQTQSLDNNLHLVIGMQRSEKWITDHWGVTTVITWTAGQRRTSLWQKEEDERGEMVMVGVPKWITISMQSSPLAVMVTCLKHVCKDWKLDPWGP